MLRTIKDNEKEIEALGNSTELVKLTYWGFITFLFWMIPVGLLLVWKGPEKAPEIAFMMFTLGVAVIFCGIYFLTWLIRVVLLINDRENEKLEGDKQANC